jgi:hypothetical protein
MSEQDIFGIMEPRLLLFRCTAKRMTEENIFICISCNGIMNNSHSQFYAREYFAFVCKREWWRRTATRM